MVEHLIRKADYYKHFIPVTETRRNKYRSTRRGVTNSKIVDYSAAALDSGYKAYVNKIAEGGVWGDHVEVSAFADSYQMNVVIYTSTGIHVMDGKYTCNSDKICSISTVLRV